MKCVVYNKACVCSMSMYGAETWVTKAGVFQRLQATERRMLRMICGVTLKDMVELKAESGERTGQPPLAGKIRQDNKLMMIIIIIIYVLRQILGVLYFND